MGLQIAGRSTHHSVHLADPQGLNAGIWQVADPYADIHTFFKQVDHTVEQERRHRCFRVLLQVPDDARHHIHPAKKHWRGHCQVTAGFARQTNCCGVGLIGGTQHLAHIVKVTDDEVAQAMRMLFADTHNVAEGAGAASFAAAMQERAQLKGQVVGTTLCGGNVDSEVFAKVLANAN